jgi:hypothetical protein
MRCSVDLDRGLRSLEAEFDSPAPRHYTKTCQPMLSP